MRNVIFFALMIYSFSATGLVLWMGGKSNFHFGLVCVFIGVIGGALPFFIDKYLPA